MNATAQPANEAPPIEKARVEIILIPATRDLDPIRVITEDYLPGSGRIIIQCHARAWVGYWGGMGGRTIRQFVVDGDPDYIIGNLLCQMTMSLRQRRIEERYLTRIVRAVQAALREHQMPTPDNTADLLESIDLKAEAGLCQMTHAGTREFLKDIRTLVANGQEQCHG